MPAFLPPFLIAFVAVLVGAGLAGATVVGLVNSRRLPPSKSPANVSNPVLEYGTTN